MLVLRIALLGVVVIHWHPLLLLLLRTLPPLLTDLASHEDYQEDGETSTKNSKEGSV